MSKPIEFLKDVRVELAKVTWPTRQEIVRSTLVVIGLGIALAIFLGAWDLLFRFLLQRFIIS